LRAVVLAAHRKVTALLLPDALVTGAAPHSAVACSTVLARSRIGPTSATTWARLTSPMPGSGASSPALACPSSPQRPIGFGDGGQQDAQQSDLGAHQLSEHLGSKTDRCRWRRPQPPEQLGRAAAAAVGVPPAERGQAGLAEPGRRLRVG
jgi:hypothetical protein